MAYSRETHISRGRQRESQQNELRPASPSEYLNSPGWAGEEENVQEGNAIEVPQFYSSPSIQMPLVPVSALILAFVPVSEGQSDSVQGSPQVLYSYPFQSNQEVPSANDRFAREGDSVSMYEGETFHETRADMDGISVASMDSIPTLPVRGDHNGEDTRSTYSTQTRTGYAGYVGSGNGSVGSTNGREGIHRFVSLQSLRSNGTTPGFQHAASTPTLGNLRQSMGALNIDETALATGISYLRLDVGQSHVPSGLGLGLGSQVPGSVSTVASSGISMGESLERLDSEIQNDRVAYVPVIDQPPSNVLYTSSATGLPSPAGSGPHAPHTVQAPHLEKIPEEESAEDLGIQFAIKTGVPNLQYSDVWSMVAESQDELVRSVATARTTGTSIASITEGFESSMSELDVSAKTSPRSSQGHTPRNSHSAHATESTTPALGGHTTTKSIRRSPTSPLWPQTPRAQSPPLSPNGASPILPWMSSSKHGSSLRKRRSWTGPIFEAFQRNGQGITNGQGQHGVEEGDKNIPQMVGENEEVSNFWLCCTIL